MIKVRKYETYDAYRIKDLYPEFSLDQQVLDLTDQYSNRELLVSLVLEGEVIAVMGGQLVHERNLEVFSIMGEGVKKMPIAFYKTTQHLIKYFTEEYALDRVQMTVEAGNEIAEKWAEALGFEQEGLMRCYKGVGRDYYMYGRARV